MRLLITTTLGVALIALAGCNRAAPANNAADQRRRPTRPTTGAAAADAPGAKPADANAAAPAEEAAAPRAATSRPTAPPPIARRTISRPTQTNQGGK